MPLATPTDAEAIVVVYTGGERVISECTAWPNDLGI
jgi:hypothetical protein